MVILIKSKCENEETGKLQYFWKFEISYVHRVPNWRSYGPLFVEIEKN